MITVLAIVITHSYGRDKYFPNPDPKFNVKDVSFVQSVKSYLQSQAILELLEMVKIGFVTRNGQNGFQNSDL